MIATYDIVRNIVNDIDNVIKVNSVVGNIFYTTNTKYLSNKSIVKVNGVEYRVTSFVKNESVTLDLGGATVTATELELKKPTFLHGTASSVNNEYLEISNQTREKTPFIWLLRGYTDTFYDELSSKDRDSSIRLFFMDETNADKWRNDEHDTNAINQMYELSQLFIKVVQGSQIYDDLGTYSITDRPRFGVEIANRGSDSMIIDEDLSGVELNMILPIFKNCLK